MRGGTFLLSIITALALPAVTLAQEGVKDWPCKGQTSDPLAAEAIWGSPLPAGATPGAWEHDPVVRPEERHVIDLASGVRWERLTSHQHEDVDFLHVIYDVGGSSAGDTMMMRHPGREYGYVLSGYLGVQLGFEEHKLGPGDSIAFDSTQPHRLWNLGEEPVHGIWFVVGREG